MLPYFAAFDHSNYTRWGVIPVFPADVRMLPQTAPEVQQAFESGDFVTKETASTFNQIPDDQARRHVNKSGQVTVGLVWITRTDSARDRWSLTYNERAKLSEDTKEMFNVVWVWGVESLNKTEYTILLLASQTGCCPEQAVKCGRFQSVYMYICVGGRIQ